MVWSGETIEPTGAPILVEVLAVNMLALPLAWWDQSPTVQVIVDNILTGVRRN